MILEAEKRYVEMRIPSKSKTEQVIILSKNLIRIIIRVVQEHEQSKSRSRAGAERGSRKDDIETHMPCRARHLIFSNIQPIRRHTELI